VLNGLKGIGVLYLIYGMTYYYSAYAGFENPYDIQPMRDYFFFTAIAGSAVVVPVLIFCGGFLQTFSFL
jgi:hypothetical protein